MTTLEALKQAVKQLSPEELAEFRCWFAEFDVQLAADKIDQIAAEALWIKGKLAHFSPEALADFGRWFAKFDTQVTTDKLDQFAIEALRIKGK